MREIAQSPALSTLVVAPEKSVEIIRPEKAEPKKTIVVVANGNEKLAGLVITGESGKIISGTTAGTTGEIVDCTSGMGVGVGIPPPKPAPGGIAKGVGMEI